MLSRIYPRWLFVLLCAVPVTAAAQETKTPVKAAAPKAALKSLSLYPASVTLDGPRAEQRVGALGTYADGRTWDLSRSAEFASANPAVAVVEDGIIRPVKDGATLITVRAGGQ